MQKYGKYGNSLLYKIFYPYICVLLADVRSAHISLIDLPGGACSSVLHLQQFVLLGCAVVVVVVFVDAAARRALIA